jgi:Protein involved in catabolism of external DNA
VQIISLIALNAPSAEHKESPPVMLSYRHSFHAGNHADVLKHTVQSLIIESLKEKEKPFLYLDTHSGAGRYQLSGEHAERTGEYLEGIGLLWQRDDLPEELAAYMSVVHNFNRSGTLRYYPGSPLIARQLLRPQDKNSPDRAAPERLPAAAQRVPERRTRQSAARRRLSAAEIPAAAPVAPRPDPDGPAVLK